MITCLRRSHADVVAEGAPKVEDTGDVEVGGAVVRAKNSSGNTLPAKDNSGHYIRVVLDVMFEMQKDFYEGRGTLLDLTSTVLRLGRHREISMWNLSEGSSKETIQKYLLESGVLFKFSW